MCVCVCERGELAEGQCAFELFLAWRDLSLYSFFLFYTIARTLQVTARYFGGYVGVIAQQKAGKGRRRRRKRRCVLRLCLYTRSIKALLWLF
jgi:hypothetical protein